MTVFLSRLRIPTLLGLSILLSGIAAGVYFGTRDGSFVTKASPTLTPQNLTLTNIDDSQVTISWQTPVETPSFIVYGQSLNEIAFPLRNEQTALDLRDTGTPSPRKTHYFTLKNLLPKTSYEYKIISGRYSSEILEFVTSSPPSLQNGFSPVIGSVLINNEPLEEGVAYLTISGAVVQSAVIKSLGNFVIPLSTIRKSDLSDTFELSEGATGKITIISDSGESTALFKVEASAKPLPPLHLGQNLDLTALDLKAKESSQTPAEDMANYDLNEDGLINAADYAIVLKNFGKNPQTKADLNSDRVVDSKDLEIMAKRFNELAGY